MKFARAAAPLDASVLVPSIGQGTDEADAILSSFIYDEIEALEDKLIVNARRHLQRGWRLGRLANISLT